MTRRCAFVFVLSLLLPLGCSDGPFDPNTQFEDPPPFLEALGGPTGGALRYPDGFTQGADGTTYVISHDGITAFEADGTFRTRWFDTRFGNQAIRYDRHGDRLITLRGIYLVAVSMDGLFLEEHRLPAGARTSSFEDLSVDDQGNIWVLDDNGRRLIRVAPDWETQVVVNEQGVDPGEFERPRFVVARDGHVHVFDAERGDVQVFATDGSFERVVDLAAVREAVDYPDAYPFNATGFAVDPDGTMFLASGYEVRFVRLAVDGSATLLPIQLPDHGLDEMSLDSAGRILALTESGVSRFDLDGVLDASIGHRFGRGLGDLEDPEDIAVGRTGDLFVLDYRGTITVFSPDGTPLRRIEADDSAPYRPRLFAADGAGGLVALGREGLLIMDEAGALLGSIPIPLMLAPVNVASDHRGAVYTLSIEWVGPDVSVARVRRIRNRVVETEWTVESEASPRDLAARGDEVWIAGANHAVLRFTSTGRPLEPFYASDPGPGRFGYIESIAFDVNGNVLLGEGSTGLVYRYSAGGRFQTRWNGAESGLTIDRPEAIVTDVNGRTYVLDSYRNRVLVFGSGRSEERGRLVTPATVD